MARWLLPALLLALFPATASASLKGTSWSFVRAEGKAVKDTDQRLRFEARARLPARAASRLTERRLYLLGRRGRTLAVLKPRG